MQHPGTIRPLVPHLWLAFALFAALVVSFVFYAGAERAVGHAHETRHRSFVLADALRQSSDDLTRMVRTYVATGDTRFKQAYLDILAFREGLKPAPAGYERLYWDLVLVGALAQGPVPPQQPIITRMREAGFTPDEFRLLAQAKANSDAITRTERLAMALVEDADGDANGADPATRARAVTLLHDRAYHDAKAAIMRPLGDFMAASTERTEAALAAAQRHARWMRAWMATLALALVGALWLARRSLVAVLGAPLERIAQRLQRLGEGGAAAAPGATGEREPPARPGTLLARVQSTEQALARLEGKRLDSERQRSQAEAALRASESRLRAITDNTSAVIFMKDLQGRYLHLNRRFEQLFHVRREDLIGRTDHAIFPAAMADAFVANDRAAAEAGHPVSVEETVPQDDGLHTYVAVKFPLRDADGQVVAVAGVATDITDRKLDEQRLQAKVEARTRELREAMMAAEQASRSKSAFLANMSHEIRTPLHAIAGMAHLIRGDGLSPRQAQRMDQLEHASAHLLQLLSEVLDMARIEAGKLELEQRLLQPAALLQQVQAMLEPRALAKGLALKVGLDGALPASVLGDATRLRQCLLNLTGNAIKFSRHGTVELRASARPVDAGRVELRYEVLDQGVGIAPAALARLFQPFEQAHAPSTPVDAGGSGLGLAITRRLAEHMGGQAGARSEPGRGSAFWFTAILALAPAEPANDRPADATTSAAAGLRQRHAGRRVLVAEDNPVNQEIVAAMLDNAGLTAELVADGQAAVARGRTQPHPDLVLMDMRMPQLDGVEATRQLRAAGACMPIIAMTANAFAEDAQACLEAGMDDFLTKPVMHEPFLARLLDWLDRSAGNGHRQGRPATAATDAVQRTGHAASVPEAGPTGRAAPSPER